MIDDGSPRVSLAMLADYLESMTILSTPSTKRWALKGFIALPTNDSDENISNSEQVLFICQGREAPEFLQRFSNSAFLVVYDGDDFPQWMEDHKERVMLIKKDRAYSYILFMVQEFFLRMMFWNRRMSNIALGSGAFQDLVDASEEILENFIVLSDNANAVIAYTHSCDAPEKYSKQLIETGYYTPALLSYFDLQESFGKNIVKKTSELLDDRSPVDIYIFPVWHRGIYFGRCMMICSSAQMTDGLRDYLKLFLDWVSVTCERIWRVELESKNPVNMMFVNIITGRHMSEEYIRARISQLDLPEIPQYKLILIKTENISDNKRLVVIMDAARRLNNSKSITFRYNGDILALLYASDNDDGSFSIKRVIDDVDSRICEPYSVYSGTSQVFEHLEDLDLAYRQATLACNYKDAIDAERAVVPQAPKKTVYAFENALLYYLIDKEFESNRFKEFSFSHSFLDKIIERDKTNGTNDFALLWVYLNCDCNISSTAKQLFMHRNTVIYHIDKIKDTFLLDFSDEGTRDRCLVDYKIKFLSAARNSMQ